MTKYFPSAFVAVFLILPGLCGTGVADAGPRIKTPSSKTIAVKTTATSAAWVGETGTASYYGINCQGRRAASGIRFDKRALTAAHPWLPFGTRVRVTLAGSGRSVIVTITDRLYSSHRIVDLSVAAARELGMIHAGLAEVTLLPV